MNRSSLQEDLAVLVSQLRPCFARAAQYGNVWDYIEGLLAFRAKERLAIGRSLRVQHTG